MKLNFFKYIAYTAILATFAGCVYDFQADLSSQGISSEYIIVDGDIIVGDTSVIYREYRWCNYKGYIHK